MRSWTLTLLAATIALAQDKPVYDKSWQEESIVVKRKDEKSGKEAAIIRVNFVKPHKLSECLGKQFCDVLRDYPSARLFKGGSIRASFKTGDPYHVHLLKEDGSDLAIPAEGDVVTLTSEDLKPAKRLVAVSGRFDVSVTRPNEKESRLHLPPYVVSISLEEATDPLAEGTAQSTAQVGGGVLADVRPYSDYEFALSVIHEGDAQPIEIGFGEHLLRPRMTFEGGIGNQQQHVGIYPIPMVARKAKGELNVGVGGSTFKYKDFPHTLLDLEFPTDVDALAATVKGKLSSTLPLTALLFSGAMVKEPMEYRASAIELGDKRELEAKVEGEQETFFFVRLWTAWKKRGGMLGCGMMEEGTRWPYKYLVEPPPRPFYTIRMRGSRTSSEAGQILGASPSSLIPLLGTGLMGVGLATSLGNASDPFFGTGGGASAPVAQVPVVTTLPSNLDPGAFTVTEGSSRVLAGGAPSPNSAGPEVFKLWVESGDAVNFPDTLVATPSKPETIKAKYTYDDGDPNTFSWKKILTPTVLDGAFHVSSQFLQLPEGKDLPFDVWAKFIPQLPKQYVSQFAIQHNVKGVPVVDAQVTLKGRGILPQAGPVPAPNPNAAFKLKVDPKKIAELGKVPVGAKDLKNVEDVIIVSWDDADPKKDIQIQFDFEFQDVDSKGGIDLKYPLGRRLVSSPGSNFNLLAMLAPNRAGKHQAKLLYTCRILGTEQILAQGEILIEGQGVSESESPFEPALPAVEVKIPSGSSFKPAAKYKVMIKDKIGYRTPTEDEKKKGCPPGTVVILTPRTSKGSTIFVNSGAESIPDIPTIPAKPLPTCPSTPAQEPQSNTPRTLPPTQINPEEPYVIQIPTEMGFATPDILINTANGAQQPDVIGSYTTPDGRTVVIYTARTAAEMAGTRWIIKDKEGKTIAEVDTYYWAPAGPPEIDREQIGTMTFQRFGKGPAAPIVIQAKNLAITQVVGDIKDTKVEKTRATGTVSEGSPKVNVTFHSSNAEKEGEIDLIEPKK